MALHHLHEAGLVGITVLHDVHIGRLVEPHGPVEAGLGLGPPGPLLGPVAVAASVGFGGEVDHGDAPAVFGDPRGGPEPAVGVGGELSLPAAKISADPGWVGRPALDDLNEHGLLSLSAMSLSSIPFL